jgi:hypothetical protein
MRLPPFARPFFGLWSLWRAQVFLVNVSAGLKRIAAFVYLWLSFFASPWHHANFARTAHQVPDKANVKAC